MKPHARVHVSVRRLETLFALAASDRHGLKPRRLWMGAPCYETTHRDGLNRVPPRNARTALTDGKRSSRLYPARRIKGLR